MPRREGLRQLRRGRPRPHRLAELWRGGRARAADILWEDYKLCVRAGAHCAPLIHKALGTAEQGMVRFSFSHQNTEAEVFEAAEAVCQLAEEL